VVDVLTDFELGSLVGYFVSDNDSTNDVAVKAICRDLELGIAEGRRLRCLGHIINLSAKAFLFGTEDGSFDFEISDVGKMKPEVRQALGPIGKLHNIIHWVQRTPQRAQSFKKLTSDVADVRNGKLSLSQLNLMLI
jgi:hypothetical protein